MKKTFIAIAAMAMSLMACNKIEGPVQETLPLDKYVINANIPGFSQETKAMKSDWADGDKINIWFDNIKGYAATPDVILTYDATNHIWESGTLVNAPANPNGNVYALFEGHNDLSAYSHTSRDLKPLKNYSNVGFASPMTYVANAAIRQSKGVTATYEADGANININITKWQSLEKIRVVIEGLPSQPQGYLLKCDDFMGCTYLYISNSGSFDVAMTSSGFTYEVNEGTESVFYFGSNINKTGSISRTFTLRDNKNGSTKTFTAGPRVFNSDPSDNITNCSGIKLVYSDFE